MISRLNKKVRDLLPLFCSQNFEFRAHSTFSTMVGSDTFLHLARPLGPAAIGLQPSTAPLNVIIQPQVR